MMSEREKIRQQLSAYLDGELSDAEASRVAAAAARDAELARELKQLRAIRSLVRGLPRASAPPDIAGRIMARAEPPGSRRSAPRWVRYAAAAAALVAAVGVGFLVMDTIDTARRGGRQIAHRPAPTHETDLRRKDVGGDGLAGTAVAVKNGKSGLSVGGVADDRTGTGGAKGAGRGDGADVYLNGDGFFYRDALDDGRLADANDEEYGVALTLANATNIDLDVPDVPGNRRAVQKDIEKLLVSNGLVVVAAEDGEPAARAGRKYRARGRIRLVAVGTAKQNNNVVNAAPAVLMRQNTILANITQQQREDKAAKIASTELDRRAGDKDQTWLGKEKVAGEAAEEGEPRGEEWAAGYEARAVEQTTRSLAEGAPAPAVPPTDKAKPGPSGEAPPAPAGAEAEPTTEDRARQAQKALAEAPPPAAAKAEPGLSDAAKIADETASRPAPQRQDRRLRSEDLALVRQVITAQRVQQIAADFRPLVINLYFLPPEELGGEASLRVRAAQDQARGGDVDTSSEARPPQCAPADR